MAIALLFSSTAGEGYNDLAEGGLLRRKLYLFGSSTRGCRFPGWAGGVTCVSGTDAVAVMAGLEAFLARTDGGEPSVQGFFNVSSDSMACAHIGNGMSEKIECLGWELRYGVLEGDVGRGRESLDVWRDCIGEGK